MTARRVYLDKQTPSVFRALAATAQEIRERAGDAGVSPTVLELVNIRVSQLNRCAFCLDKHSRLALDAGETAQRIAVLPAWRETELFDDLERAALEIAEAVVATDHLDDATYDALRTRLSDAQLSVLTWAAITISAFNRVSIMSGHPVRARRVAART